MFKRTNIFNTHCDPAANVQRSTQSPCAKVKRYIKDPARSRGPEIRQIRQSVYMITVKMVQLNYVRQSE